MKTSGKGKKVAAGFKAGGASIKFGLGKVKGKFQQLTKTKE